MCECPHCTKLVPALDWIKENAPKEHFEAICDLYDECCIATTDLAMLKERIDGDN